MTANARTLDNFISTQKETNCVRFYLVFEIAHLLRAQAKAFNRFVSVFEANENALPNTASLAGNKPENS